MQTSAFVERMTKKKVVLQFCSMEGMVDLHKKNNKKVICNFIKITNLIFKQVGISEVSWLILMFFMFDFNMMGEYFADWPERNIFCKT